METLKYYKDILEELECIAAMHALAGTFMDYDKWSEEPMPWFMLKGVAVGFCGPLSLQARIDELRKTIQEAASHE